MLNRIRTTAIITGLTIGSVAVGAVANALTSSSAAPSKPHASSQIAFSSLTPSATAQASFGLLRRQVTPSDSLAPIIAQRGDPIASTSWQSRVGVDIAQARRAKISGHGIWLAAGPANACMFAQRPGNGGLVTCGVAMNFALDGSATTVMNSDGSVTAVGVLPDDAHNARIVLKNGQRLPVTISDNAFWITVKPDPVAIEFTHTLGQSATLKLYTEH